MNQALSDIFAQSSARVNYNFASFVSAIIERVVEEIIAQLYQAKDYKDISSLESKLLEFCNKYSLVSEKNEIKADEIGSEPTVESVITGKSLAQLKLENQEAEEYFSIIKESKLDGSIVLPVGKKDREVECYYHDSRQYEEYYETHQSDIKSFNGRVLAVIEDKKGVIRADLIFTTKGLYVLTKALWSSHSSVKPIATYDEIRVSKRENAIEHIDGRKIYDQDGKVIDYNALGDMLHKIKLASDKYNAQSDSSIFCHAIIESARRNCAGMLQSMKYNASSADKTDGVNYHNQRQIPDNNYEARATITNIIPVEGGVSIKVKIQSGCFSNNDGVVFTNHSREITHEATIRYVSGGNKSGKIEVGEEGWLYFVGVSKDCVSMESIIVSK
jgi:hypothetical protein